MWKRTRPRLFESIARASGADDPGYDTTSTPESSVDIASEYGSDTPSDDERETRSDYGSDDESEGESEEESADIESDCDMPSDNGWSDVDDDVASDAESAESISTSSSTSTVPVHTVAMGPGPSRPLAPPKPAIPVWMVMVVMVADGEFPQGYTLYTTQPEIQESAPLWHDTVVDAHDIPGPLGDLYLRIPDLSDMSPRSVRLGKRPRSDVDLMPWTETTAARGPFTIRGAYTLYIDME